MAVKNLKGKRCLITGAASGIGRYELTMRSLNNRHHGNLRPRG